MKLNKHLLTLIGIIIATTSCDNRANTPNSNSDNPKTDSTEKITQIEDTIQISKTSITPKTTVEDTVLLLFPGDYESKSAMYDAQNHFWEAMGRSGDTLIGLPSAIITTDIDNPWGEEGNLEGIRISDQSEHSISFYISGINYLNGISMVDISKSIPDRIVLPGTSYKIGPYTLSATGENNGTESSPMFTNYTLTISGTKDGHSIEQVLIHQDFFDDAMINFHWIGDLDQDGLPDMMIDLSHKYSYSMPSLFLSSPSGKNSLVKLVTSETRYGC